MIELDVLSIGSGDADNESDLRHYFVETTDYTIIKKHSKQIIIGGRGTGKSALFRILSEQWSASPNINTVPLIPDSEAWKSLKKYANDKNNDVAEVTREWELIILAKAIDDCWSESFIRRTKAAREFLAQISKHAGEKLFESAASAEKLPLVIDAVHKILDAIPFTFEISSGLVKIALRERQAQPKQNENSEKLAIRRSFLVRDCYKFLQDVLVGGKKVYVLVDGLDDNWDGSESQVKSLVGLFSALGNIRERIPNLLNVVVFIRQDMYQKLYLPDETKYFTFKHELRWNVDGLLRMLRKRVRYFAHFEGHPEDDATLLTEVFENGAILGKPVKEFFSEFVVPRPRDYIMFLNQAIDEARRNGNSVIGAREAQDALHSYSKWRRELIKEEWRFEHDNVIDLVDSFAQRKPVLSCREINNHLDRFKKEHEIPAGNRRLTKPKLLNDLLSWGVLGTRRGRTVQYRWDVDRLEYISPQEEDELVVHPSMWPVLSIDARRGTAMRRAVGRGQAEVKPAASAARRDRTAPGAGKGRRSIPQKGRNSRQPAKQG